MVMIIVEVRVYVVDGCKSYEKGLANGRHDHAFENGSRSDAMAVFTNDVMSSVFRPYSATAAPCLDNLPVSTPTFVLTPSLSFILVGCAERQSQLVSVDAEPALSISSSMV